MAEPAKRNATYADIEALPENVTGEILYGNLVAHPRPLPVSTFDIIARVSAPPFEAASFNLAALFPPEDFPAPSE